MILDVRLQIETPGRNGKRLGTQLAREAVARALKKLPPGHELHGGVVTLCVNDAWMQAGHGEAAPKERYRVKAWSRPTEGPRA